jgi:hypothetical protein
MFRERDEARTCGQGGKQHERGKLLNEMDSGCGYGYVTERVWSGRVRRYVRRREEDKGRRRIRTADETQKYLAVWNH